MGDHAGYHSVEQERSWRLRVHSDLTDPRARCTAYGSSTRRDTTHEWNTATALLAVHF